MADASDILARNLAALRSRDPQLADRIAQTDPTPLDWQPSKDGPLTASVSTDGRAIALASRYAPIKEAGKLVGAIDHLKNPCVVVMGHGLGYHTQQLAADTRGQSVIVVYEPDLGLLRAVYERIDHSKWLSSPLLVFVTDAEPNRGQLISQFEKYSAVVTQGTHIFTHPPSRQLHPQCFARFSQLVAEVLAYCRTIVATTLVNSSRTVSNVMGNLSHYVAGANIDELAGAAAGKPAVCVSAGPSLVKNVDLLRDPAIREKVVLIAVQTALRPLLDRGIRPDFVTAIDYSPICQRFYENLPPLPDVTLVAQATAHPVVFDSFPGPIRVMKYDLLQTVVSDLPTPAQSLRSAATVAHLSFYLAQHLGCDPIMLIGQDLGFSNGLYYAPGTAVHQVWSSELNPFNTIENMEWKRIVRMRGHLQKTQDIGGQPIFTDEQMITYLKQFERDFAQAPQQVIDATEGGVPKQHATPMPLADALERFAREPISLPPRPPAELDAERLSRLVDVLKRRLAEVTDLLHTSRAAMRLIETMLTQLDDPRKFRQSHDKLDKHRRRVEGELKRAFEIVNFLNAVGAMRRHRADRAIHLQQGGDRERQKAQLTRDRENVDWIVQASTEAEVIVTAAVERAAEKLDSLAGSSAAGHASSKAGG